MLSLEKRTKLYNGIYTFFAGVIVHLFHVKTATIIIRPHAKDIQVVTDPACPPVGRLLFLQQLYKELVPLKFKSSNLGILFGTPSSFL